MKNIKIQERLNSLRSFMKLNSINAFVIPSTDPHLSEYPAERWESRKWISGFTGSAGIAVVTLDKAGLWTDSRYFLQATNELENTGFTLFKDGLPETPNMISWIIEQVGKGGTVGIDGLVYASYDANLLINKLKTKDINTITTLDPFEEIWKDRPQIPSNKLFIMPEKVSGESTKSKINRITKELDKIEAQGIVIVTLDAIAWTFNIRGNDVNYNPVTVAYGYVSKTENVLFINQDKLSEETTLELKSQGVKIKDYNDIFTYISNLPKETYLSITGNKINYKLLNCIPQNCKTIDTLSPIDLMKSIKNNTELNGFRNAMVKDGVALVKFYMWLENALDNQTITEITIAEKLREYRSKQDLYVGESFGTIAGYGGNGAIIHYSAKPESCATIKKEGLLLIDSGAQFKDGTTDITRTIAVGPLTNTMKQHYTCVLKGHIAIATSIFPEGTRGSQLDVLARKALWDKALTYWHGTGHGVGHFLNVHEGPQNIRLEENSTTLKKGMVTSNEPGIYLSGKYGIRIENLIVTQEYKEDAEFGKFFSFETITLCPIDTTPIDISLLTKDEISWFNNYHKEVYDKLNPFLDNNEKNWLKNKTKEI